MIDQLFDFIKSNSQESVINNPEVPNELNESVIAEAQNSLVNGLRGLDQQTLQQLQTAAANDNLEDNPQVNQLSSNLSGNLTEKLGLNSGVAKTVAMFLIPMLLKKLLGNNSASGSNNFNVTDILGNILGGNSGISNPANTQSAGGGLLDKLSGIGKSIGLDKDGDGDVDLNDITRMVK